MSNANSAITNASSPLVGQGPLVSVGIPVCNGGRYLRQTLEALLAQDYTHLELIISDNASTDDTEAIATEFAARDSRIRYQRNEDDIGARCNFRRVVDMATGTYFMWASCHDLWAPDLLRRCVDIMERDPAVVLCHSRAAEIDAEGNRLGPLRGGADTRSLSPTARYKRVVRRMTGYPIYGLFRRDALRSVRFRRGLSADAIILAELAFAGEFACVPAELFFLRRMSVARNWKRYFANLHLPYHWWSFVLLFARMFRDYRAVVRAHQSDPRQQAALIGWTKSVLWERTVVWFAAMATSFVWRGYYRPW